MRKISEQGIFNKYSQVNLNESMDRVVKTFEQGTRRTTVFVSHKHADLEELKGLLGYLEQVYKVKVYIDSQDPNMPRVTNGDTAKRIKERITQCDKFILLATNGAIESKWCNWELGYGDSKKYLEHIALLPMKPKGALDKDYKGSEYMSIYPYIAYYEGYERYPNGMPIPTGYYVCWGEGSNLKPTPLNEWLSNR